MKLINSNEIIIKKSRFLGFYYELDTPEEVSLILSSLRKTNKKAKHFPYAYIIQGTAKKSDDKEPGGIGTSFLNILERNKLDSHLLLVVRYYGGTKLGASNLLRTYSRAANNCINKD